MGLKALYNNAKSEENLFLKIKYILHFVVQTILYAIIVLFLIVAFFLVIYFVDLVYNVKSGNNKKPLFDAFIIISPSMVPTIKINDAIIIRREDGEYLDIGDIITFSSTDPSYAGLTITHRIVGKQESQGGKYIFRTKGDNNNSEDPALVQQSNIYGRVILKIPKLGLVRQFLTTSYGFVFAIVIPALTIVILDIFKFATKGFVYVDNKRKEKRDELDVI